MIKRVIVMIAAIIGFTGLILPLIVNELPAWLTLIVLTILSLAIIYIVEKLYA